jgi:hypothetical protein
MYELWSIVGDNTGFYPFFLEDIGDFNFLYVKFKEKKIH